MYDLIINSLKMCDPIILSLVPDYSTSWTDYRPLHVFHGDTNITCCVCVLRWWTLWGLCCREPVSASVRTQPLVQGIQWKARRWVWEWAWWPPFSLDLRYCPLCTFIKWSSWNMKCKLYCGTIVQQHTFNMCPGYMISCYIITHCIHVVCYIMQTFPWIIQIYI